MANVRKLDEQEIKILKQLVKNPRASDNQISKETKIPVMTVNRKRKQLEEEGRVNYHTEVIFADSKTRIFTARQMYIIQLKMGISRKQYIKALVEDKTWGSYNNAKFRAESYLGEKDGHLTVVIILESDSHSQLSEVFNEDIVKGLKSRYGDDCIRRTLSVRLDVPLRMHHNYLPFINMEKGKIKKDWCAESLYVGESI